MGVIITLVGIAVVWSLLAGSEEGKAIIFLGIVAILAWIGSNILSFLIYISYVAILLMLLLIGVIIFEKLFK